jgi:hypothetical protein
MLAVGRARDKSALAHPAQTFLAHQPVDVLGIDAMTSLPQRMC